jgi:hypothetical protein
MFISLAFNKRKKELTVSKNIILLKPTIGRGSLKVNSSEEIGQAFCPTLNVFQEAPLLKGKFADCLEPV